MPARKRTAAADEPDPRITVDGVQASPSFSNSERAADRGPGPDQAKTLLSRWDAPEDEE